MMLTLSLLAALAVVVMTTTGDVRVGIILIMATLFSVATLAPTGHQAINHHQPQSSAPG